MPSRSSCSHGGSADGPGERGRRSSRAPRGARLLHRLRSGFRSQGATLPRAASREGLPWPTTKATAIRGPPAELSHDKPPAGALHPSAIGVPPPWRTPMASSFPVPLGNGRSICGVHGIGTLLSALTLAATGLLLAQPRVVHGSPSQAELAGRGAIYDHEHWRRDHRRPVPKPLADLDVGEPRTVRLFYFLPNDRPFREEVVQRTRDEMLRIQTWYGRQMKSHGYGYRTFRLETDADGDPVVHRVDGRHPDRHYLDGTWACVNEIGEAFDLSKSIIVVVVDISTNRIDRTAAGSANWSSKQSGVALVGGRFSWRTLAHELAHTFGMGHDFRHYSYILSYPGIGGDQRHALSACSAGVLAAHPYFNPDVGVEWAEEDPLAALLSATSYPVGSEVVPIRLRLSAVHGLQQVRVRVPTHDPRIGGLELKTCRAMMGETEAVVEIDYDGVIARKVHPISITVVDRDGNRGGTRFDLWERSRQHLATFELGEEVHGVVFVPGGTTLASGSAEGVELWDLKTRTGTTTSLGGDVTAVALSAGGGTLASGSSIGQVQLLDLEAGRVTATFSGATHKVRSLAFSSDGAILASGGPQGIQLWDVETRTSTVTLPGGVTSVAFSPNGSALATGSVDGVRVWDVETEAEVATYRHGSGGGGRGVNSVAFSPDGTLVASGGDDTIVRLWEVATGDNVAVLEGHGEPVRSLAFSPDGTMLATGGPDLAVNLWDPVSRDRLVELRGGGRGANALAFSPDGATLAAGTEDGKIGLWDLSDWVRPRLRRLVLVSGDDQQGKSGEPLAAPLVVEARDQYDDPLPGVEVTFLVTEGDGRLGERFTQEGRITDANGRTEVLFTLGPNPGANAVEAEVSGLHRVIFGAIGIEDHPVPGVEAEVSTWQLPDGAILRVGKGRVLSHDRTVAFSSDGRSLAVLSEVGLWLYDVATSRPRALVALPGEAISCMAFSPDGTTIATGGSGPIRLWEVATGIGTATILEGHPGWVGSLAFLTDGTLAAAGSGHVSSWDVATGTMLGVTTLVLGNRGAFWFSPDGSVLAATGGYSNTTIRLWDPATGTGTAKLTGHKRDIGSLAFSPDGSMLASGSSDHTVKLWDVAAAANVATLEGHTSGVGCVAFAPDGRTLAVGSYDGTVRLWDPATATLLSTFRGGADGRLSGLFPRRQDRGFGAVGFA